MKSKNLLLIFNKRIMYKPIIYKLTTDYEIIFNILEAKILPKQEGRLILELKGSEEQIDKATKYLIDEEVQIEFVADKMKRDENLCFHCGACTSICRVDALAIDRDTMEVKFIPEKCVACGLCRIACPVKAMSGYSIDVDMDASVAQK